MLLLLHAVITAYRSPCYTVLKRKQEARLDWNLFLLPCFLVCLRFFRCFSSFWHMHLSLCWDLLLQPSAFRCWGFLLFPAGDSCCNLLPSGGVTDFKICSIRLKSIPLVIQVGAWMQKYEMYARIILGGDLEKKWRDRKCIPTLYWWAT